MRKPATTLAVLLVALIVCAAPADAGKPRRRRATAAADLPAPRLPVTGASLLWPGSETPLWSVNGNAELPIASATKLMTALVVLQRVQNLQTVFTQNDWLPSSDDSQIGLVPGERMTVHDLLLALLLPSADDAAEDLAYNVGGGSVARFVGWMNDDALGLGLEHTHYSTPIGLDTPGNYSSPDDLVRLASFLMSEWPFFSSTVALPSATLTSGRLVRHIVNTDDLVAKVPWIHGVKTGHTGDAGYVLVSEARRNGFTLLAAVLGTTSQNERDASALSLLDWGFSEFRVVQPVHAGQRFARRRARYAVAPAVIVAKYGYRTLVGRSARIRLVVGRLRRLVAPMARGAVVGQLHVDVSGRPSVRIPLVLARRLPAVPARERLRQIGNLGQITKRPITLLMSALLLGGGVTAVTIGRRHRPGVVLTGPVKQR